MAKSGPSIARLFRLCLKELRETLRDRRTILTLVLMPVLVYPLLAILFTKFVASGLQGAEEPQFTIGTKTDLEGRYVKLMLEHYNQRIENSRRRYSKGQWKDSTDLPRTKFDTNDSMVNLDQICNFRVISEISLEEAVEQIHIDVGVRVANLPPNFGMVPVRDDQLPIRVEMIYREGSPVGTEAVAFLESRFQNETLEFFKKKLRDQTGAGLLRPPLLLERVSVESTAGAPISIGSLVPLILILMTITGAVYPSIDLTAGERERGTLETLIAAPVPRRSILFAKYIAVLVVASLTATINLFSMVITAQSSGLNEALFGPYGLQISMIFQLLSLMILFAAFFSAVLLAITCLARSFKEAQAYTIPLMLMSIAPGVISLFPGIELTGPLSVAPLINIVLLTRDMFAGEVELLYASVAVISTLLYAGAALSVAASIFGTDAILYGSPGTWGDFFRRPQEVQQAPMISTAVFCLAMMFPCFFVASGWLAQLESSVAMKLVYSALLTVLLFGGFPLVACWLRRVDFKEGLGIRTFSWIAAVGAVLLGLSLWTFAHELVLLCNMLGIATLNQEQLEAAAKIEQAFRDENVSLFVLILTTALTPAIFEELFFRGFLFSALRRRLDPLRTIIVSALLFGLFHVIVKSGLAVERMVPTTFLGLALGYIAYRSGSLIPSIMMHATSNALLLTITYYREEILQAGWGTGNEEHLPIWLLGGAVGLALAGIWFVFLGGFSSKEPKSSGKVSLQTGR